MISPALAASFAAAALLAAIGIYAFIAARRDEPPPYRLTGVGQISHVTLLVSGIASFAMAYHVIAYALDMREFRAPWWLALTVAAAAVVMSLGVDALENSRHDD